MLDGEDLLYSLRHTSLPCLRLLAIRCMQLPPHGDERDRVDLFRRIFERSSTKPLLVVLQGEYFPSFFHQLITSLPPNTHLLVDFNGGPLIDGYCASIASDHIKAIYCGRDPVDLSWLSSDEPAREASSWPLKVYLPMGFPLWSYGFSHQEEFQSCGFEIEALSNRVIGQMLHSLMPVLSKYTADAWECELLRDIYR
jgi:hypothetical protein